MCGRTVEVEVVLLDILAVVSLAVREPKQALFQDRVSLVPQRQRKAQLLLVIAEAPESVLAPPVGAGARLVAGEIVPGVAVVAVVLPDCPPLALAEVGTPFLPKDVRLARLVQPFLLRGLYYRVHFSPPLLHEMSFFQSVSNTSEKVVRVRELTYTIRAEASTGTMVPPSANSWGLRPCVPPGPPVRSWSL